MRGLGSTIIQAEKRYVAAGAPAGVLITPIGSFVPILEGSTLKLVDTLKFE